ncbi:MAG: phosphate/phosphite/phosphonate ABC transporter substrate-binding protein [Myxococcaceae bacterium]
MDEPRSYLPPPPKVLATESDQPPLPPGVDKLRIGLVPITNPEALQANWSKLVAYLSQRLKVPCELVMGADYDDAGKKLAANEVELVAFSPYAYVRAGRQQKLKPLVTVVADGSQTAGSYILVRQDSKRQTFDDLKGASFGYVDRASTSGYLYPVKLMLDRGWDPKTAFGRTEFFGNHEAVLMAIHDGKVEAGATYFGAMKQLKEHRGIDPLSFRVVAKTERTPHDVLAMRADADERIGKAVSAALLRLSVRDEEGRELLTPLDMNGFYPAEEKLYDRVRAVSEEVEAKVP